MHQNNNQRGGNIYTVSAETRPDGSSELVRTRRDIPIEIANDIVRDEFFQKKPSVSSRIAESTEGIIYRNRIHFIKKKIHITVNDENNFEKALRKLPAGTTIEKINKILTKKSQKLAKEIDLMTTIMVHPGIIKWFGGSTTQPSAINVHDQDSYEFYLNNNYVIMENMTGDLYSFLSQKTVPSVGVLKTLSELVVFIRDTMFSVLSATKHMILHEYINTDLKLENIFVRAETDKDTDKTIFDVKVADPNFVYFGDFPDTFLNEKIILTEYDSGIKTYYSPELMRTTGGKITARYKSTDNKEKTIDKLKAQMYCSVLNVLFQMLKNIITLHDKSNQDVAVFIFGKHVDEFDFNATMIEQWDEYVWYNTLRGFVVTDVEGLNNIIIKECQQELKTDDFVTVDEYELIFSELFEIMTRIYDVGFIDNSIEKIKKIPFYEKRIIKNTTTTVSPVTSHAAAVAPIIPRATAAPPVKYIKIPTGKIPQLSAMKSLSPFTL